MGFLLDWNFNSIFYLFRVLNEQLLLVVLILVLILKVNRTALIFVRWAHLLEVCVTILRLGCHYCHLGTRFGFDSFMILQIKPVLVTLPLANIEIIATIIFLWTDALFKNLVCFVNSNRYGYIKAWLCFALRGLIAIVRVWWNLNLQVLFDNTWSNYFFHILVAISRCVFCINDSRSVTLSQYIFILLLNYTDLPEVATT